MGPKDSTDDTRTRNKTLRHQYRVLTESEKIGVQAMKDCGQVFLEMLDSFLEAAAEEASEQGGTSPNRAREFAIARTKIEEAVMWAVKGITA